MTLCACGCGRKTNVHPYTIKKLGWIKGITYYQYIAGHNGKLRKTTKQQKINYQKEKLKKMELWIEGQVCKCGCKKEVTPGRLFITGHNSLCSTYHTYIKGKTYEEIYGKEKAEKQLLKISLAHIGQKSNKKGKKMEDIYGKQRSIDIKDKIRKTNLGKKQSNETKLKHKKNRALRVLPTRDTSIEIKIQNFLNELKIVFIKHQYIKEIEHCYQCDIFIPKCNLVVECDGNYWHNYPNGREIDHIRTREMLEKGFNVLRLWESEIKRINIIDFIIQLKNIGVVI